MTERQLLAAVIEIAGSLGILVYHEEDSRRSVSDPGFPDLVLAGAKGMLFAELKSDDGRMSLQQIGWRRRLTSVGASWYLWRPRHLQSGEILQQLRAIA